MFRREQWPRDDHRHPPAAVCTPARDCLHRLGNATLPADASPAKPRTRQDTAAPSGGHHAGDALCLAADRTGPHGCHPGRRAGARTAGGLLPAVRPVGQRDAADRGVERRLSHPATRTRRWPRTVGPYAGQRAGDPGRLRRRPVRQARFRCDRRQGPLPAAGGQRLRRRAPCCRQHRCSPGTATSSPPPPPGPTSGTWRANTPASAACAAPRPHQPRNRAARRRRGARQTSTACCAATTGWTGPSASSTRSSPTSPWWTPDGAGDCSMLEFAGDVLLSSARRTSHVAGVAQTARNRAASACNGPAASTTVDSWALVKNSRRERGRRRSSCWPSPADPARQARRATPTRAALARSAKGATDRLDARACWRSRPPTPPIMQACRCQVDEQFWRDNRRAADPAFRYAWLTHS